MADDIKIELTSNTTGPKGMWWVDIHMTNKRGTKYAVECGPGGVVRYVYNVMNSRRCTRGNRPKWVQKTIEEQLPVVAIMLS